MTPRDSGPRGMSSWKGGSYTETQTTEYQTTLQQSTVERAGRARFAPRRSRASTRVHARGSGAGGGARGGSPTALQAVRGRFNH
jgi:hypothetical protein